MHRQQDLSQIGSECGARLLATTAAAEYLGVTPRTLTVWRCTKRYAIPYIKVGRLVKYRREELDRWLESRTIGAVAQEEL